MAETIPILRNGAFDPETNEAMGIAFDSAWRSLEQSGSIYAAEYRAALTRNLLAHRIIELVQCGERDPARLRDAALGSVLGPGTPTNGQARRREIG
jgi:hypothetical protein